MCDENQSRIVHSDAVVISTVPVIEYMINIAENMNMLLGDGISISYGTNEKGIYVECSIDADNKIYNVFKDTLISNGRLVEEVPGTQTLILYLYISEDKKDTEMIDNGAELYSDLFQVEENVKNILSNDFIDVINDVRDGVEEIISTSWGTDEYMFIRCHDTVLPTIDELYNIKDVITDKYTDDIVTISADIRPNFCDMCQQHQAEWVSFIIDSMPEHSNAVINTDGSLSSDPLYMHHLRFAKEALIRVCDTPHDTCRGV